MPIAHHRNELLKRLFLSALVFHLFAWLTGAAIFHFFMGVMGLFSDTPRSHNIFIEIIGFILLFAVTAFFSFIITFIPLVILSSMASLIFNFITNPRLQCTLITILSALIIPISLLFHPTYNYPAPAIFGALLPGIAGFISSMIYIKFFSPKTASV